MLRRSGFLCPYSKSLTNFNNLLSNSVMKTSSTFFFLALLLAGFIGISAQDARAQNCNIGSNIIPCPGLILGQENSGVLGTFTGSEEWSAMGKAPFPAPGGDFPYGVRLQRNASQMLVQMKRRSGITPASPPMDANIYFGTTRLESGKTPPTNRLDFDYVFQDQSATPPKITNTNIMTLTGAFSKMGVPFACSGGGSPCFGRVGIERSNPTYTLDVNGATRVTSLFVSSDARFKQDVKTIKNPMAVLQKLRGTTYEMVNSEDLEGFDFGPGQKSGFIAQEVETVLPHLVTTDVEGYKSVDYVSVIPYLVEGMKELNAENAALKAELEDIRQQLEVAPAGKGAAGSDALGTLRKAELFQNFPNPFDQQTKIKYFLPQTVSNASLVIFDMNGRQVRTLDIERMGEGSIVIDGNELEAGMYLYSLLADGQEIETRRMILTQ